MRLIEKWVLCKLPEIGYKHFMVVFKTSKQKRLVP